MKKVLHQIKNLPQITKAILVIGLFVYLPLWFLTISFNSNVNVVLNEGPMPVLGSDSVEYKVLADNLSEHHFFSMDLQNPEYFRVPGYPFFISTITNIYNSYFLVTFFQIILTLVSGFLIYKISVSYVSNRLALVSSILFLLEPSVVIHSLILLSDIPFVFLLVLFTYIVFLIENNILKYLILGLILGISVLFRPISMFLVVLFPVYVFFAETIDIKKKILSIAVFISVFIFAVCPWMYRNKLHSGQYFISTISSYNFFYYNIPMFSSWNNGGTEQGAREVLYKENSLDEKSIRLPENIKTLDTINANFLKNNFTKYLSFHAYKTTSFFFGSSLKMTATIYKSIFNKPSSFGLFEKSVFVLERILWLLALLMSFLSIFYKKNRAFSIYCLVMILYFAMLTGPVSYPRYRLPVEPFIFMMIFIHASDLFFIVKNKILLKFT